jgi:hypothetical protein
VSHSAPLLPGRKQKSIDGIAAERALETKHSVVAMQFGAARKHSPPSQRPTSPVPQTVPSGALAQTDGAGVVVVVVVEVVVDVVVVGGTTHPSAGSTTSPPGQTVSPGLQVPGGRHRELPFE